MLMIVLDKFYREIINESGFSYQQECYNFTPLHIQYPEEKPKRGLKHEQRNKAPI